jgi:hypothetical protein
MKNILNISLLGIFIFSVNLLLSNTDAKGKTQNWSDISEGSFNVKGERRIIPQQYRTVKVNYTELRTDLTAAPFEILCYRIFHDGAWTFSKVS